MRAGELRLKDTHPMAGSRTLEQKAPLTLPLLHSQAAAACLDDQEQGDGVQYTSYHSSSPFVYLLISKLQWGWAGPRTSSGGFLYAQMCNH